MRSHDSRVRQAIEHLLHAIAALALLCAVGLTWRLLSERDHVAASGGEIEEAVARWSTVESPGSAHFSFTNVPVPRLRDWIGALARTGTEVTWEGSLTPSGVVVEPIVDPKRPVRIWVAAPAGTTITLRDELGVLDRLQTRHDGEGGVVVTAPAVKGVVRATVGDSEATAVLNDSLVIKPLLVLGNAGWEAKFVIASLEEHGWEVDARLRLSESQIVEQGPTPLRIDTARYAAVIALDGTAARHARAIDEYVRAGGGLVAAGDAAGIPSFASLLGAKTGRATPATRFGDHERTDTTPRAPLALTPLIQLERDAVVLERTADNEVVSAARRVGNGRVLLVGYRDTWRWRMASPDVDPVTAFREWWSAMVSSVASAPRVQRNVRESVEPTPLASLVSVLGPAPPRSSGDGTSPLFSPGTLTWLAAAALGAMLAEWASRRLRGAP